MSQPEFAIRARNLSKVYRLGRAQNASIKESLSEYLHETLGLKAKVVYEPFYALNDVSFDIRPGEVIGVVGKNGSGKSTLLKILSEVTEPSTGVVELWGKIASVLEVGAGFHPELSGRENIFMNGALLGMTTEEVASKFDAIVKYSGVEKFIDSPVKHYSSGMYVRLAFSIVAHLDADILLLDEVLAVGDVEFRRSTKKKITELRQKGKTIVVVSHDTKDIAELCSRCFLLEQGRLISDGTPNAILEKYLESVFLVGEGKAKPPEERWEADDKNAPGNSLFRIRRVAVQPEGGAVGDPITSLDSFIITVDYDLLSAEHGVDIAIGIYDLNAIPILNDSSLMRLPPEKRLYNPGSYRIQCRIYRELMGPGVYTIGVFSHLDGKIDDFSWESLNLVTFKITPLDSQKDANWAMNSSFCLPALDWKLEPLKL